MIYVPCENIPRKSEPTSVEEPSQENDSGTEAWEVENWGDIGVSIKLLISFLRALAWSGM